MNKDNLIISEKGKKMAERIIAELDEKLSAMSDDEREKYFEDIGLRFDKHSKLESDTVNNNKDSIYTIKKDLKSWRVQSLHGKEINNNRSRMCGYRIVVNAKKPKFVACAKKPKFVACAEKSENNGRVIRPHARVTNKNRKLVGTGEE